jgi:hypothetical protein
MPRGTPPKKTYKTVNEAAHEIARKRRTKGPQDEAFRQPSMLEQNPFGQATKLNKAKGSPNTHRDGLGSPVPKSTGTKSKNRFKQSGYLA